jgi:ferritin
MSQFPTALNEQIGKEFGASQQYVAIAVRYDAATLPQLASYFYRQAAEERGHAMMMVQYLLDCGEPVRIPGVEAPRTGFADDREPIAIALEQEKRVTDQIAKLLQLARKESEYVGEQFLGWFLQEQREEVALMASLIAVIDHAQGNMLLVEDYLGRQQVTGGREPGNAPPVAGGGI